MTDLRLFLTKSLHSNKRIPFVLIFLNSFLQDSFLFSEFCRIFWFLEVPTSIMIEPRNKAEPETINKSFFFDIIFVRI